MASRVLLRDDNGVVPITTFQFLPASIPSPATPAKTSINGSPSLSATSISSEPVGATTTFSNGLDPAATFKPEVSEPPASGLQTETRPLPTAVASTPTIAVVTVSAAPAATSNPPSTSSDGGLSLPLKVTAIVVPILAVLALIPIAYLFYLRRRHRRNQHNVPELRIPLEKDHLRSHSRQNSHSSMSFPSPFFDKERARSNSFGVYDRPPSVESSRPPSPNLPSPSQPMFRTPEAWPLTSVLPDPPVAYDPHVSKPRADSGTLRPDSNTLMPEPPISRPLSDPRPSSSTYTGTPVTQTFPPTNLAVNNSRGNFSKRESDAVSEMSIDAGTGRRRSDRSADEMSFVSALSPDEHEDRHFSRMI